MFGNTYFHGTLRKVVVAFGNLFNDINIVRRRSNGTEEKRIKVPINYGPREKYLVREKDDPDLNRPVDIILPQMSFQLNSFRYRGANKLNTIHKQLKKKTGDITALHKQFNPVSYNVGLELSIMAKYTDDGNQIVEQILPFFTPAYTVTIDSVPEMDLQDDLPFQLDSIDMIDSYDDNWKDRRHIIWTLHFTAVVFFYGPIRDQKIIREISIDGLVPTSDIDLTSQADLDTVPREFRVTTVPDPLTATADDDYGYTQTVEEFNDSKKYNPETGNDEDI